MELINDIDFSTFPITRYQGSKRKILPWIYETLKDYEFETVLDACGGSGCVSYLFKKMNKTVTYNDVLKFNHYIGKALIENSKTIMTDDDIKNLLTESPSVIYDNTIQKNFKGIYYLTHENRWLDKIANNILQMNHYHGKELEYKKAIAFYSLFQASLIKRPFNLFHRNNLSLRVADVERTFGNKTTWDRSFNFYIKKFIKEVNESIFDNGKKCIAINKSIIDIEPNFDLVYIDSPYLVKTGNNETSNYLKCYHFLEGIVNYPDWEDMIDYDSSNLRLKCTNDNIFDLHNIHKTFELLLEKFEKSTIVISYKKGGVPSVEFLIKIMKRHKKNVITRSQHYKYALNKQNGDAKKNREVLIIGS